MSTEDKNKETIEVTADNIESLSREQLEEYVKSTNIEDLEGRKPEADQDTLKETGEETKEEASEQETTNEWNPPTQEEYEKLLKKVQHQDRLIGRQKTKTSNQQVDSTRP